MTILSVIQSVCPVIGLDVPSAVVSSSDREHVELKALAQEMAERIAKAHEWQKLNTLATYTGDASTEDFSLPTDFDRMLKKAQVWGSSTRAPFTPISDRDQWLGLTVQATSLVLNSWIIYGGQIHIKPAMASAATAKHWYQSNLIIAPNSGANKATITADDDTFRLSERLLKLGMIWQWKANKGLAYAQDMDTYEDMLEKLASDDKGSRVIRVGRVRMPSDVTAAYPWTLGS